jgi:hypothetical protein
MDYLSLLVGFGLAIMWIISLAMGSASLWFTWLVFVAAAVLIVGSFVGMRRGATRSHTHVG